LRVRMLGAGWGHLDGFVQGTVYNASDRHIAGDVVFHVFEKDGNRIVEERRIRQQVDWPPQQLTEFTVVTGLDHDLIKRRQEVALEPAL